MLQHKEILGTTSLTRNYFRKAARLLTIGVPAAALLATGALAQDAGGGEEEFGIEEIVVTSRKRGTEILQDIPTAITAFSEDMLADMGVTDFEDFAYQVPGLTFLDGGPGERRYVIRGIQSAGQQQVAVYYDEVPLPGVQSSTSDSGSQTTDLKIYDMERIEVLKGPQGTTFGANSQIGTVRFITNKPDASLVEASIKAGVSSTHYGDENWDVFGMLNVPIVQDRLAVRIVAYSGNDSGYIDNVRLNNKDINWVETTGVRAMLRYDVTENATLDFMVWFQERDSGGDFAFTPFDSFGDNSQDFIFSRQRGDAYRAAFLNETFFQTGDRKVGDFTFTGKPDDQQIWSATLNWDIGDWAHLTAAGSYYDRDFDFKFDSSWIIFFFGIGDTPPMIRPDLNPAMTNQQQSIEQKAFEIRLNSTGAGPMQWLLGGFFRDRESKFQSFVPVVDAEGRLFDPGTPFFDPPAIGAGIEGCQPCVFARIANKDIEEKAVFGEVSYAISDQFEIMGGLRWFEVNQSDFGITVFPFALFPPNPDNIPNQVSVSEDKLIKKAQISYRPSDDILLFALAAQGFRLGGTNNQGIVAIPQLFGADDLWNIEVGMKSSWLDNRMVVNLSAFKVFWDNLQVAGSDPTGAFGFITNAGKAEVTGVELEVFARPSQNWDIVLGASWLPQRELSQDQRTTVDIGGVPTELIAPGIKGDKIPRIPRITLNGSAQYNFPIPGYSGLTGAVRGEFSYKGKSRTEFREGSQNDREQRSYALVNARFAVHSEPLDGSVTFFIENLFDVNPDVLISAAGDQPTRKITARPRTFGIEFTKRF